MSLRKPGPAPAPTAAAPLLTRCAGKVVGLEGEGQAQIYGLTLLVFDPEGESTV